MHHGTASKYITMYCFTLAPACVSAGSDVTMKGISVDALPLAQYTANYSSPARDSSL